MQCIQNTAKLIKSEPVDNDVIISGEKEHPQGLSQKIPVQHHNQKVILSPRVDYHHHRGGVKHHQVEYAVHADSENSVRSRSPLAPPPPPLAPIASSSSSQQRAQHPMSGGAPQIIITRAAPGVSPSPSSSTSTGTALSHAQQQVRVIKDGRFYDESRRGSISPPSSSASSSTSGVTLSTLSPNGSSAGPDQKQRMPPFMGSAGSASSSDNEHREATHQPAPISSRKYVVSRHVNVISSIKLESCGSGAVSSVPNSSGVFRTPVVSSSSAPMRPPPPPPPPKIKTSATVNEEPSSSIPDLASNGVVIATENKHKSILYDEHSVHRVEMITDHIGMVYSGMGPDYRVLVRQARKMAQIYYLNYKEPIPVGQLVQRVATLMQEYTQSGGVRPFGVSLLICGWNNNRPYLFQCDPSGAYFAWKATAMGKNSNNGKSFLEKRYSEDLELDDAVHTAILILKEGFEGKITADNIEIGVCDKSGFKRLDPSTVQDYLANIP